MTGKEYLLQLQKMDAVLKQKLQEKADLRAMSVSVGRHNYCTEKVQMTHMDDAPYVKTINKIENLDEQIDSEIERFVDRKHSIINQIQGLAKEKHVRILYLRYVKFKSFEEIAVEMELSYQYTLELHGSALQAFEKTYKNL